MTEPRKGIRDKGSGYMFVLIPDPCCIPIGTTPEFLEETQENNQQVAGEPVWNHFRK
jgi:hypothetical protein